MNVSKTEQMCLNIPADLSTSLSIDGQNIAKVEDFKYLGYFVASSEKDIQTRIALAWAAFDKLKGVQKAPLKSKALKVRLFDASCISILLYGCETWVLISELENKLNVFARKAYRIMLDINQADDHLTNQELYRITGQRPLSETIRLRQLQFTGHCLRMPLDEPANIYSIYKSNTKDVGKRGRPDCRVPL